MKSGMKCSNAPNCPSFKSLIWRRLSPEVKECIEGCVQGCLLGVNCLYRRLEQRAGLPSACVGVPLQRIPLKGTGKSFPIRNLRQQNVWMIIAIDILYSVPLVLDQPRKQFMGIIEVGEEFWVNLNQHSRFIVHPPKSHRFRALDIEFNKISVRKVFERRCPHSYSMFFVGNALSGRCTLSKEYRPRMFRYCGGLDATIGEAINSYAVLYFLYIRRVWFEDHHLRIRGAQSSYKSVNAIEASTIINEFSCRESVSTKPA